MREDNKQGCFLLVWGNIEKQISGKTIQSQTLHWVWEMKEYAIEFAYNEMSFIRDLASKKLHEVCTIRGANMVDFYMKFLEQVNSGVMDIIPGDEIYILASIIRRCDEMEQKIKKDLTGK